MMKCKLKLTQPKIMCSGRDSITCTYRGKILKTKENGDKLIQFKYKGVVIESLYNPITGFYDEELEDIKLK